MQNKYDYQIINRIVLQMTPYTCSQCSFSAAKASQTSLVSKSAGMCVMIQDSRQKIDHNYLTFYQRFSLCPIIHKNK